MTDRATADVAAELDAVRALQALWLTRLPAPCTLACRVDAVLGVPRDFWVTTSRPHFEAASRAFYPVLHGDAWVRLAQAAAGNLAGLALAQWLGSLAALGDPPAWVLRGSLDGLLGPAPAPDPAIPPVPRVTVGEVLAHFGAELVALDPPPTACLPAGVL